MGLRDVTLFAIACIVGTRWIPAAAHAGPGSDHAVAAGRAVLRGARWLSRWPRSSSKYPGAGGLYLWTRGDFGPWHGFLVLLGLLDGPGDLVSQRHHVLHERGARHAGHRARAQPRLLAVSLVAIWVALGTNLLGVKVGKWTENLAGPS